MSKIELETLRKYKEATDNLEKLHNKFIEQQNKNEIRRKQYDIELKKSIKIFF